MFRHVELTVGASLVVALTISGRADAATRHVLILHAYSPRAPYTSEIDAGLTKGALEQQSDRVELFNEALESYRFPSDAHAVRMREYLREKYADVKLDVVIAIPDPALDFLLQFRDQLFRGVPIVALVNERPRSDLASGVTAVWGGPLFLDTVSLALQLRPGTRRLLVIEGSLTNIGGLEREFRAELRALPALSVDYLRDRPLQDVIAAVRSVGSDAAVLYVRQLIGQPHQSIYNIDGLKEVISASPVPVYTVGAAFLGYGEVGGSQNDLEIAGSTLMRTALRIANGEAVDRVFQLAHYPVIDWRALRRWGLSEDRLPFGAVVRFKRLTVWSQYRRYVIGASVLVLAEALLIVSLLRSRERRRRVERALWEKEAALRSSYEQVQQLAGRLISAQEAERKRIARDLHDDLSQKLALLNVGIDQLALGRDGLADVRAAVRLHELSAQAREIASHVHRMLHELHPSRLELLGLVRAVQSDCRDFERQYDLRIDFRARQVGTKIPPDLALCVYRIIQEALHNVVRHSGTRDVSVRIASSRRRLHLHVADHGIGFDATQSLSAGLGVISMRERVHYAGGSIAIRSSRRRGTRIAAHLPLADEPSRYEDRITHMAAETVTAG